MVTKLPARFLRGRFTGLTIAVLWLLFLVSVIGERALREVVVSVGFSVLLVFAIQSVGRQLRIVALTLAAPTFISHWIMQLSDSMPVRAAGFAFTTASSAS